MYFLRHCILETIYTKDWVEDEVEVKKKKKKKEKTKIFMNGDNGYK